MKTELERVEVEPVWRRDHDLSVDHGARRQPLEERLVQLGEIAVEGAEVAALDEDVGGAAEDDGAEAVPLRLEEKRAAGRERLGQLGEHRLDGRLQRSGGNGRPSSRHATPVVARRGSGASPRGRTASSTRGPSRGP